MPKPTLSQRLTQISEATPSEKKLIEFFRRAYPQLAFDKLTTLSDKAGVSKTTVARFVQRLGYSSFYEFSETLREELVQRIDTPLQGFVHARREGGSSQSPRDQFAECLDGAIRNLQRTKQLYSSGYFTAAVNLLSDQKRPLYLMGAASAEGLLNYFALLLNYFRADTTVLSGNVSTIVHRIVKIQPEAVLFTISYDRYPKITHNTMRVFHQAGCQSILITERRTSPLLDFATVPLVVDAEGPGLFKSRCAALVAMEALLAALGAQYGETIPDRLASMTRLFGEFDVYLR